jgi:hypothetical protein
VEAARFFEIIDLEKYCVTVDLERTKVIFLVWVVGVAEVIVDGNCLHNACDCFGARRHAQTLSAASSEKVVWVRERPAGGIVQRLSGPRAKGSSDLLKARGIHSCFQEAASGQSRAKSSRGRVISPTLAACFSRQRSLNRSPAFSTGMASHHAPHWLSSLANTR